MAAAIPRGVLMLIGGAVSDRFPPNRIAAIATGCNTLLASLLTLMLNLTDLFLAAGGTMLATTLIALLIR